MKQNSERNVVRFFPWSKYAAILVMAMLVQMACNDPSLVGSGLLEDDRFEILTSKDFNFEASTQLRQDRVVAYPIGATSSLVQSMIVGKFDDPIFGQVESEIYAKMIYSTSVAPVFNDIVLDSVVMILTYDTLSYAGDLDAIHHLKVYEIDEDMTLYDTIYADQKMAIKPMAIGEKTFKAAPKDSVPIILYGDTMNKVIKVLPQIRIPINLEWAKSLVTNPLLTDTSKIPTDTVLEKLFRGICIKNESENNAAVLGLNLSTTSNGTSGLNRFTFFYTQKDGTKVAYPLYFSGLRYNHIRHEYNQSAVKPFIDNVVMGDSLLFIQNGQGLDVKLKFKDLSFLSGKILNHAEIVMEIADLPEDNKGKVPYVYQLLGKKYEDNKWVYIDDVQDIFNQGGYLDFGFGGSYDAVTTPKNYTFNITKHLQELVKAGKNEGEILLEPAKYNLVTSPVTRAEGTNRTVIYGPKHSAHPMKLQLTYTVNP